MKQGYKETAIGWIPEDWEVVKLGDVAELIMSNVDKKNHSNENAVFLCNYLDVYENQYIRDGVKFMSATASDVEIERFLLKKGDVIVTKDSETKEDIAHASVVVHDFTNTLCGYHLALIRPIKRNLDNIFLSKLFSLNSIHKELVNKANGTTRYGLTVKTFEKLIIPLPPFSVQNKIASILSTVDDKIDTINEKIEHYQKLKNGLIQQLLTRGIGHTKFKDSPLGRIPESWSCAKLGTLGEFFKGKGISKNELSDAGVPCIRYGEIYTVHDYVIKKFYSFISREIAEQSFRIMKNDILFAGSGETLEDIGKAVVFIGDEEVYAGGDNIIFRAANTDGVFLSYCLNSRIVTKQRTRFGQGHSVVHIYARDLAEILIPVPPYEEQQKIAEGLTISDENIDILKVKRSEYETMKKGLMQKLLTGEIRVKTY